MLNKLKPSVRQPVIIYGTGVIIAILSGVFFQIVGYPLVVTATETLNIISPPIYMISIFLPYGILIGELFWFWNEKEDLKLIIILIFECLIIASLSFIRFVIRIPFSGHTIILFFYLPHQIFTNKFRYKIRILIGLIVLFIVSIYKILFWNDIITYSLGAILGIALWIPGYLLKKRIKRNKNRLIQTEKSSLKT